MIMNARVVNIVLIMEAQMEKFVNVQMIDFGITKLLIVVIIFHANKSFFLERYRKTSLLGAG